MATLQHLRDRLDAYTDRADADYTNNRDLFINTALRQIARRLGVETNQVELVQSVAVTSGTSSFQPGDDVRFDSHTHLTLVKADGTNVPMRQIPVEWLRRVFWDAEDEVLVDLSNPDPSQGQPKYYAVATEDDQRIVHIRPESDASYTIDVVSTKYTVDLVNPTDDNFITIEAEDTVLYLALAEAWDFFEDVGRANRWRAKADEAFMWWKNTRLLAATEAHGGLSMNTYKV